MRKLLIVLLLFSFASAPTLAAEESFLTGFSWQQDTITLESIPANIACKPSASNTVRGFSTHYKTADILEQHLLTDNGFCFREGPRVGENKFDWSDWTMASDDWFGDASFEDTFTNNRRIDGTPIANDFSRVLGVDVIGRPDVNFETRQAFTYNHPTKGYQVYEKIKDKDTGNWQWWFFTSESTGTSYRRPHFNTIEQQGFSYGESTYKNRFPNSRIYHSFGVHDGKLHYHAPEAWTAVGHLENGLPDLTNTNAVDFIRAESRDVHIISVIINNVMYTIDISSLHNETPAVLDYNIMNSDNQPSLVPTSNPTQEPNPTATIEPTVTVEVTPTPNTNLFEQLMQYINSFDENSSMYQLSALIASFIASL